MDVENVENVENAENGINRDWKVEIIDLFIAEMFDCEWYFSKVEINATISLYCDVVINDVVSWRFVSSWMK
jgi:hypothetical protein